MSDRVAEPYLLAVLNDSVDMRGGEGCELMPYCGSSLPAMPLLRTGAAAAEAMSCAPVRR